MTSNRYSRRIRGLNPLTIEEDKENKEDADLATYSRYTSNKPLSGYWTEYDDNTFDLYRGETQTTKRCLIRSGEGQMIYHNGVIYEGTWENDKPKHVKIYTREKEFSKMVVAWLGLDELY
mgnify:CR=1 FL=1